MFGRLEQLPGTRSTPPFRYTIVQTFLVAARAVFAFGLFEIASDLSSTARMIFSAVYVVVKALSEVIQTKFGRRSSSPYDRWSIGWLLGWLLMLLLDWGAWVTSCAELYCDLGHIVIHYKTIEAKYGCNAFVGGERERSVQKSTHFH